MKRFAILVSILLLVFAPAALIAQDRVINDSFRNLGEWDPGVGGWQVRNGSLVQGDPAQKLARIDRAVPQQGEIEIAFDVRYEGGGIADERAREYHGGFGIHLGVEGEPEDVSWGAGDSYLLWLNLDTRPATRVNRSEHPGIRAQVYRSETASLMNPTPLNIDIQEELANIGVQFNVDSLTPYLQDEVRMRIRVNYDTGEIMVNDPSAPSTWFTFTLEPDVLEGRYISLRSNSLSLSFNDFSVTRL